MPRPPDPTPAGPLEAGYAFGFPLWTPRRGGERRVLVSDPWGYVRYELSANGSTRSRQVLAFWEQAEDFYTAAAESRPAARPLLYYYAFMNIVKAFLIHRGRGPKASEVHGIRHERPSNQASQLQTQKLIVGDLGSATKTAIFAEFSQELGHTLRNNQSMKVGDVVGQIVGVHRAWMSVTGHDSDFVTAEVDLRKARDAQRVFASISFSAREKDLAERVASRANWTRVASPSTPGLIHFETKKLGLAGTSYQESVTSLANGLRKLGMHLMLTEHDGYRIYFSDLGAKEAARLPQLLSMYAFMFFLGSITRYRPYDFDRYVAGKWGWLVNEFLNSQPAQFVYLMTSEIVGKEVVIPLGRVGLSS